MFALANLSREVSIDQVLSTRSVNFFTQWPITKLAKSLLPSCCSCLAAASNSSVLFIRFSKIISETSKLESQGTLLELAVDVEGSQLLSSVEFLFPDVLRYTLTQFPILVQPIVERLGCPWLNYILLSSFVT